MKRNFVTWIVLYCFVFMLAGCYSNRNLLIRDQNELKQIKQDSPSPDDNVTILKVVAFDEKLHALKTYEFLKYHDSYAMIHDSVIVGMLLDSTIVSIPVKNVQSISTRQLDVGKSVVVLLGVAGLIVIILALSALAKDSHAPFVVYSIG